jgi:mRNA deadenylase 3'-5' endonuclease subunit Ccr4
MRAHVRSSIGVVWSCGFDKLLALVSNFRTFDIAFLMVLFFCFLIIFQEVETEQFYEFFKPELERDGYEGIFSPKSRAKTMVESERKHVDGCAIFFRTRK